MRCLCVVRYLIRDVYAISGTDLCVVYALSGTELCIVRYLIRSACAMSGTADTRCLCDVRYCLSSVYAVSGTELCEHERRLHALEAEYYARYAGLRFAVPSTQLAYRELSTTAVCRY
eukprot:3941451-Rhodomonas_salina.1